MMSDPDLYITGLLNVFISFFVLFLVEKIIDRFFAYKQGNIYQNLSRIIAKY